MSMEQVQLIHIFVFTIYYALVFCRLKKLVNANFQKVHYCVFFENNPAADQ